MIETIDMRVSPEVAYVPLRLQAAVSTRLGVDVNRIKDIKIRKRSIDARQRNVVINLSLDIYIDELPADEVEKIAMEPTQTGVPVNGCRHGVSQFVEADGLHHTEGMEYNFDMTDVLLFIVSDL